MLCKHEVVGSIPSGSTMRPLKGRSRDQEMNTIPPGGPIGPDGGFDIVNEGSVRAPRKRGLPRADLDDIIVWLIFYIKAHALTRAAGSPTGQVRGMSFAENDQAHKGF